MPKAFPKEFKEDVLRVALSRDSSTSLEQVATDFGISASCLQRWVKQAEIDEGRAVGVSTQEHSELREANRRIRMLEMENEVLRRAAAYLSQAQLRSPK